MNDKKWFIHGMKHGIPIAMGYFAVSLTIGIAAEKAGIEPVQAALMSALMHASAGQFAAIAVIGGGAGLLEMMITTVVVNLRYILMSCALSQKIDPKRSHIHRFFMGHYMTDELFGISIANDGAVNPFYFYGAAAVAGPSWTIGTYLGALLGGILPAGVINAFGIALYAMFIAIIIPPARKNRVLAVLVTVSMAASFLFNVIPLLRDISSSMRTIILTLVIAAGAAIICPVKQTGNQENTVSLPENGGTV